MRRSWMRICGCRCMFALAVVTAISLPAPAADSSADVQPVSNGLPQQQWAQALSLLSVGQFHEASQYIREVTARGVTDERVRRVHAWLAEFEELRAQRAERTQKDYEKYVEWVKEETGKELWLQASLSCALAFNNARDQDAFRREPWLLKAVEGASGAALEYEEQGKWFKAASIHARLGDIFPQEKEYRESLDRCREHIRLELTYEPDSDWKAMVKNIAPEMASDAFHRIDSDYLKEPVFKDAVIGGLKHVLLLAGQPKLAKVFDKLEDRDSVDEFRTRVNELLRRAEGCEALTVDDLVAYFERVLRINEEVRLLPETVLTYEFAHGALKPLDRFSDMIWPSDVLEFTKHTQGRFSGVGIQIRKAPGGPIKVISPLEDTPAYRQGVQPGDLITRINGKPAKKFSITGAVREITGPPGTKVTLTFKRIGVDKEFDLTLEREEITISTIKGYERDEEGHWRFMIDPERKIGYARMSNFTEGTIDELEEVVRQLGEDERMQGFILDLRDNPGGPLEAAVDVADLFLDGDKRIVSTKDRNGQPWAKSSSDDAHFADFPMIVMVNEYSASASEIVTGALQVHHRALIVGERTYGKGSVQRILPLNNSRAAFLKLTTALYYLPNGQCLHKDEDSPTGTWGVDPDVEVKLVPKERIKVNQHRLKKDILKGRNQKELTEEELESVAAYWPSTQPGQEDLKEPTPDQPESDSEYRPSTQPGHQDQDTGPGEQGPAREDQADGDEDQDQDDDEDDDEEEITRTDPNDWPEIDPQLEAALMLMRIRLEARQAWPRPAAQMAATPADPAGG